MQTIFNRRRALALVAAVPVAAALGAVPAFASDDELVGLINRYRAEIDVLNATRGISDDDLDAGVDRADEIIAEAVELPVLTMAGAVAVISLHIDASRDSCRSIAGTAMSLRRS